MTLGRSFAVASLSFGSLGIFGILACVKPPSDPPPVIHARFDPTARVIPMPSDVLRDDEAGILDLDTTAGGLDPAERELYEFLNTRDGWSTASGAKLEFDARVAPSSIDDDSVQVWLWIDGLPTRVEGRPLALDDDGDTLTIQAPDEGWPRGATVQVAVRGGEGGVRGVEGERVECDAAFYFLRLKETLLSEEHERAFPGATREERRANAEKLEALRLELAPYFDHLEGRGLTRDEVAAMWTFTLTRDVELAMDKASMRMPLPIDLMIDPATGLVDLPVRAQDSELERDVKEALRIYDGFGPTMFASFGFTAPVDPASLEVEVWKLAEPPVLLEGALAVSDDRTRARFVPARPLDAESLYAVLLKDTVRDEEGNAIALMPPGHFLLAKNALLADDGKSRVAAVPDADAARLEMARAELAPWLDRIGRNGVLAAWPFRTMAIHGRLAAAQQAAERLGVPVDPEGVTTMTATEAALDFPLAATTLFRVQKVFHGEIVTPDFLDPLTRGMRPEGLWEERRISFTLTIPDGAQPGDSIPVVVFGHGLMTERRFVLTVADALAAKGFAAISIDFPYHGNRTVCAWNGPNCFPNPFSATGEMICPNPCKAGSSCSVDGKCRDESGVVTEFPKWPIIPMYQPSGAAFVEVDHIEYSRDHFLQAVTDLGALSRSLRLGDWESATGFALDANEIRYVGQSLGGIMGGLYTPLDPHVTRSVLNVPGGNLVDMFTGSTIFGLHIEAFFERHEVVEGTADHDRFLNIAHWLMDPVDPVLVAPWLMNEWIPEAGEPVAPRDVMIQMATLDMIIPNTATKALQNAAGDVPRKDYLAEHGFLTIPLEPAFPFGVNDAAGFLEGTWAP